MHDLDKDTTTVNSAQRQVREVPLRVLRVGLQTYLHQHVRRGGSIKDPKARMEEKQLDFQFFSDWNVGCLESRVSSGSGGHRSSQGETRGRRHVMM